jgi:imidazoleglycerol-phosphate dehydratase / histidinol-phosphatase
MKKVLFIDRDGTLVIEPPIDFQLDSLEKLSFYPEVFQNLAKISLELNYELVMVTNQDGLGTTLFPEDTFWPTQNKIMEAFKNENIFFTKVYIDRTMPNENANTRKPNTGMLTEYFNGNYDLKNSFVIGDRFTDVQLANNLGCKSIYINSNIIEEATYCTSTWKNVYTFLKNQDRKITLKRKTSETEIEIYLNLDGSGKSKIYTGLNFLDHMLEQIAKHGQFDLNIIAKGDLQIDEHHTIEDIAITMGVAFYKLLGDKKAIERYGFLLPMDDCLAQVALDFGGRPWLVWNATFNREKIGDVPSEMFIHFFKSFSDNAKCNLNIKADGENEHHKIESIFKAFAKALKGAVQKTENFSIPSTKGIL